MKIKTKQRYQRLVFQLLGIFLLLGPGIINFAALPVYGVTKNQQQQQGDPSALEKFYHEQIKAAEKQKTQAFYEAASAQLKERGLMDPETAATEVDPSQRIRIVVQLRPAAGAEQPTTVEPDGSAKSIAAINQTAKTVTAKQKDVKKQIEELTGTKAQRSFGYLVNGFSIDAKINDVEKIRKLPQVKSVTAAKVYRPTEAAANELGNVPAVWEKYKLKGEGMVISIIDTGIDYTHKDLVLSNTQMKKLTETAVNKSQQTLGYGKFFTEKVPFGHNYADNNENVIDNGSMHGQHVAGIAAANGAVQGVAPEAQVLAMKIFSDNTAYSGAYSDATIAAIEDSVILGADVINMSIGNVSANTDPNDPEELAIQHATKLGVLSVISAGNSSVSGTDNTHSNPQNKLGTGELSTLGRPGVTKEALTVASSENSILTVDTLSSPDFTFTSEPELNGAASAFIFPESDYTVLTGTPHEVVAVGLGKPEDYQGKDVQGKIALIQRGELTFNEKVHNAKAAGAISAFIYNNVDGLLNSMGIDDKSLPVVGLSKQDGQQLATQANGQQLSFTFGNGHIKNSAAGKMSDFTSWGPTPELDFKPEISAPGGNIYSLANENTYQNKSGTSMAAPFVAGAQALIYQAIKQKKLPLEGQQLSQFAKNSVMNTAIPMMDIEHTKEIISPRRQGSGQIKVDRAIENTVSVTDPTEGDASIALKDIDRTTQFSVALTNHGQQAVTYQFNDFGGVYTQVTDPTSKELYDTKISGATLSADHNRITVQPGTTVNIQLTITLPDNFQEQNFVEGYVGFDSTGDAPNLVVPYLGFYGIYSTARIVDAPMYEPDSIAPTLSGLLISNNSTVLAIDSDQKVHPDMQIISPNNDQVADYAQPLLFLLRNYASADYAIVNEKDQVIKQLYKDIDGHKDYYNTSIGRWTYHLVADAEWDGTVYDQKTGKERIVPDGQYRFKITVSPRSTGADQVTYLPIKVDTTPPDFTGFTVNDDGTLTLNASDNYTGVNLKAAITINEKKYFSSLTKVADGRYQTTSFKDELATGKNLIEVVVADQGGNTAYQQQYTTAENKDHLLLFNLEKKQIITTNSNGYNASNNSYTIKGTYKNNAIFYANNHEITTDVNGAFTASIPLLKDTNPSTQVTFSEDASGQQVIRSIPIQVAITPPALTINEANAAESEQRNVQGDHYQLSGTTNATRLTVTNLSNNAAFNLTDAIENGTFSVDIPLVFGENLIRIQATDQYDNEATKILTIYTTSSTAYNDEIISFDQLGNGLAFINSDSSAYQKETQTLTITGHLNYPAKVFKLNGETVPVNPDNLSFRYELKNIATGFHTLAAYIQDERLNDGKPVVDYGYSFCIDTILPTLSVLGAASDERGTLKVYTNQNPYTIKAQITDNLSGYSLKINHNTVYSDINYNTYDEAFFAGRSAVNVDYPLELQDGMNHIQLEAIDAFNNQSTLALSIDYHVAQLVAPQVTASTTQLTKQPVTLKLAKLANTKLYYSIDNQTWMTAEDTLTVTKNQTLAFKFIDQYGNESPVTSYQINNIRTCIAAEPTITVKPAQDKRSVKMILDYASPLATEHAEDTHLAYSLDEGKTWQDYTKPVTINQSLTLFAKTYDDAGNESSIFKETIVIPKENQEQETNETPRKPGSSTNKPTAEPTKEAANQAPANSNKTISIGNQPAALGSNGQDSTYSGVRRLLNTGTKNSFPLIFIGLFLIAVVVISYFRKKKTR